MKNLSAILLFSILFLFSGILSAQTFNGKQKEIDQILKKINQFSQYYMDGDIQTLATCYTEDGKIFPSGANIIEGRPAIEERWTLSEGTKILHHKILPEEITIVKNTAYDYGLYEGETRNAKGKQFSFRGKYVIVWKKVKGEWKIYLDIWNRLPEN